MKQCRQTPTETIWQHGIRVAQKYAELRDHLEHQHPLRSEWRLPDWIGSSWLIQNQYPREDMAEYLLMHDCGKFLCLTVDEQGRQHFPDHARVSYQAYLAIGGDPRIADLILHDMHIHTIKAADVPAFAEHDFAASLILAGLAEIHANAELFGGLDSTNFRIKLRQIDRRGRAILNLKENQHESV